MNVPDYTRGNWDTQVTLGVERETSCFSDPRLKAGLTIAALGELQRGDVGARRKEMTPEEANLPLTACRGSVKTWAGVSGCLGECVSSFLSPNPRSPVRLRTHWQLPIVLPENT